jgi:multiple sugar transport system substrate-binding protein
LWVGPDVAAEYVPNDLLVDLEPLMKADPSMARDKFFTNVVDAGKIMGRQFFFPWSSDPGLLMYNASYLQEAGLVLPEKLAKSNQWTWDSFLNYAKRLTRDVNGDGKPEVYGYSTWNWNWPPNWLSWMASNGGELVDPVKKLDSSTNLQPMRLSNGGPT